LDLKRPEAAEEIEKGRVSGRLMNRARGTTMDHATSPPVYADTGTFASAAENLDIAGKTAIKRRPINSATDVESTPRYMRDFVWSDSEYGESASVSMTLHAPALPAPPQDELQDQIVSDTITQHPHLFAIITPVKVDRLEELLVSHPNRPLINSICRGFREGFWPWADTCKPGYPTTWDYSARLVHDSAHRQFLHDQRDIEIELRQYSPSFGRDLLPGMYSMPLGVIPKPRSSKLRLINDLSAGSYSCNSMIPPQEHSVKLDGMRVFGNALRQYKACNPTVLVVLVKSDMSRAYRLIPMHPWWQIKQIVTIDSEHHVDCCNSFRGGASCHLFWTFMSLVL
jgi:hypothetical protein